MGIIAGSGDVCVLGLCILCGDFFDVRRTISTKDSLRKKEPSFSVKSALLLGKDLKSKDKVEKTKTRFVVQRNARGMEREEVVFSGLRA